MGYQLDEISAISNEVLVHLPQLLKEYLTKVGFQINEEELDATARPLFVTAWNTKISEVEYLLEEKNAFYDAN